MKVLQFGWEMAPHIYGGLAVASYGITKGLAAQGDVETTFCLPHPFGDEEKHMNYVAMNEVPIAYRDYSYDDLKAKLQNLTPEQYYQFRDHIYADFNYMPVNELGALHFNRYMIQVI